MNAIIVYYVLSFSASFSFSLIVTMNLVYQVVIVGLDPLQLVLVGTILEATVFLFEIPTGVVADLVSRRLSVIIGYLLIGSGFVIEGSFPFFLAVAVAQGIWGLGATFTSGAIQAWIVDEVGESRVELAFLRGTQLRQLGAFLGIPFSVALASVSLPLPVVLGGVLLILLSMFLIAAMPEEGFRPTPTENRSTWSSMRDTTREAYRMTKRQPVLLIILLVGLFYGLYSEGIDRLWTPHLLDNFTLPEIGSITPVVWFGIIRAVALLLGMVAIELTKRHLDLSSTETLVRMLWACALVIMLSLIGFALLREFWWALVLYWILGALRSVTGPLENIWVNRHIDNSQVRATILSTRGQVDALGQVCGGPPIGAIAKIHSIQAALLTSAFLLAPVLPLYGKAIRKRTAE